MEQKSWECFFFAGEAILQGGGVGGSGGPESGAGLQGGICKPHGGAEHQTFHLPLLVLHTKPSPTVYNVPRRTA